MILFFSLDKKDEVGDIYNVVLNFGFVERVPLIDEFGEFDVSAYEFVEYLGEVFLIKILVLHYVAIKFCPVNFTIIFSHTVLH